MRYLAVLLSISLHLLIIVFLVDFVPPDQDIFSPFGIELVSLEKRIPEKKIEHRVSENKKQKKINRPEINKDEPANKDIQHSPLKGSVRTKAENQISNESVKPVRADQPEKSEVLNKKAAGKSKNYPHIEIGSSSNENAVVLRQGKGITVGNSTMVLKRGSEARSLSALAAYEFHEDDFRGHYETSTGRQIVIIDGRAEHGRLILYDRKSGLIRKLRKSEFGDFIYTYGPAFDVDEPVKGSVVFLPGDEHWIHRFMWMPEDAAAEYPVKGRVDSFEAGESVNDCNLFVPAAKGVFPAVVLMRYGLDIDAARFSEVARHLCGKGVVVLIVQGGGSEELRTAYKQLRANPKVDPHKIGVWARGYGAKKIPRMELPAGFFKFVILTIDHPEDGLYPERVASVLTDRLPTFIGFRGVSSDWKSVVPIMLSGFQSAPHQIVMIDEPPSGVKGTGTDQKWIDCLSGDFVSSISAWLDSN
ncbi:hypothetical protein [Maridesulfovibrio sp.]|uniref:alpha/beta hydrolase family protein n=1 Tax=Maridesulfovibrio sp. TaxID=2795000 RepID=UPI0029F4872C|nr:hypothetical protein [Maridesulfovibrio sp.]